MHLSNRGRIGCPTLPTAIETKHTKGYAHEHDKGDKRDKGDDEHQGAIDARIRRGFQSDGNTHQNLGIVVDQFHDAISKLLRDEDSHRLIN